MTSMRTQKNNNIVHRERRREHASENNKIENHSTSKQQNISLASHHRKLVMWIIGSRVQSLPRIGNHLQRNVVTLALIATAMTTELTSDMQ